VNIVIEVKIVDRKSSVLSPSTLACLRQVATINLTAGCAHDCLYCYIRGYPRANRRLAQISELVRSGIKTEVRLDPIIPGFTDDESSLRELIGAIGGCGIKSIAASTLFSRPAIMGSLRKHLSPEQFAKLITAMSATGRMHIQAENSCVQSASMENRRRIYNRIQSIATEFGIEAKICACKNPDLAQSSCGIAGQWKQPSGMSLPQLFK